MDPLLRKPAAEMAAAVRQKKVSPVELTREHITQIEALQPKINAFVSFDPERVLAQARVQEQAVMRGEAAGPLAGVPVSIKSSIDTAGLVCATGSRLRADYLAAADAPLVARLRAAGAVVLGNTNVPEMLMAYETDNLLYGRTSNPWDVARTAGGSSGGESAAIASCCSAAGVGSDGGGSIRVPAHFCGIAGLKPTPGRVPSTGHFPPSLGPFTQLGVVGPMARSVRDLELMFEVIAGPDGGDVASAPVHTRRVSDAELRRVRIGYFEEDGTLPVPQETRAAVRAAAQALEQQGLQVEPFRPEGLEQAHRLWWIFFGSVGGMLLRPMFAGREADVSPTLQKLFDRVALQPPLTPDGLLSAWMERDTCRLRLLAQMQQVPVLLCPVCAIPAFPHGAGSWSNPGANYLEVMRFSQWFNLTGCPGVAVPAARSADGLPIGVQVAGRPYDDEVVLAVARKIEEALGGWQPPPLLNTR